MISAVDTNVLLDILIPDEQHAVPSKRVLETYLEKGRLVISEVVYAELAAQFLSEKELRHFLSDTGINLVCSTEKSLFMAGVRWVEYSRSRGRSIHCSRCGKQVRPSCQHCGAAISMRQRVLSDFIIGAHALAHADILLSRDRGIYKAHFQDLKVIGADTTL